jgi:hypothetical protein
MTKESVEPAARCAFAVAVCLMPFVFFTIDTCFE